MSIPSRTNIKSSKSIVYKCYECKGNAVEEAVWQDMNSGSITQGYGNKSEYYCRSCNKKVDIYVEQL